METPVSDLSIYLDIYTTLFLREANNVTRARAFRNQTTNLPERYLGWHIKKDIGIKYYHYRAEIFSSLGNGEKKNTKKSAISNASSKPREETHKEGVKDLVSVSTALRRTLVKLEVKVNNGVNGMSSTAAKVSESIAKRGRGRPSDEN